MKIRTFVDNVLAPRLGHLWLALLVPLAFAACGDGSSDDSPPGDPPPTGDQPGIVRGALSASGNQHVSTAARTSTGSQLDVQAQAETVQLVSVGNEGERTVLSETAVSANGRFQIEADATAGPFIVQALDGERNVVGMVIVPQDLAADGELTTAPMSAETTAEAEALLSVLAGPSDRDEVDTIGLMTYISAELAATATAEDLGAAALAAQESSLEVMATANAGIDAELLQRAKLDAYAELVQSLDVAAGATGQNTAWFDFLTIVNAAIAADASIDHQTQADAAAAAAVAFYAALDATSSANQEVRIHATAAGAVLSAAAAWAAQSEAASSSSAEATVQARLDVALEAFIEGIRASADGDAMAAAYARLVANVSGYQTTGGDSALDALIEAEGGDPATLRAELDGALVAATAAATTLEASLSAATNTSVDTSAIADAFVRFRADAAAAFRAALTTTLSEVVLTFGEEIATQSTGSARAILGVDVLDLEVGIDISGTISTAVGLQSGATGGAGSVDLSGDVVAELVELGGDGQLAVVATGAVDSAARTFAFTDTTATTTGTTFVRIVDRGTAEVRGMVELTGAVTGESDIEVVPAITTETTVQSQVLLELLASGMSEAEIDRTSLETFVDAAVAAAADGEGDIAAIASSLALAAEVQAQRVGSTTATISEVTSTARAELIADLAAATSASSEVATSAYTEFDAAVRAALESETQASMQVLSEARASACAAFESGIEALASDNAELVIAATARSQIEAALALAASLEASLQAAGVTPARSAELEGQVAALIESTLDATSAAQVEAAGQAFVDGMVSNDTALLETIMATDLNLLLTEVTIVEAAIGPAFATTATFEAALDQAIATATSGGQLDVASAATAIAAAGATRSGELDSLLSFDLLTTLDEEERALLADLIAEVAFGAYGGITSSGGL